MGYTANHRFTNFWLYYKKFHCSKCFNFSCPLNNQPRWVIDEFLKRNPVMRNAWKKKGWQIEKRHYDYKEAHSNFHLNINI